MRQLIRERVDTSSIAEDPARPVNFAALATQTEGYSVTDLKDLVARAVHQAAIRWSEKEANESAPVRCVLRRKLVSDSLLRRLH